jgi:homocysteine S-methyltransferase
MTPWQTGTLKLAPKKEPTEARPRTERARRTTMARYRNRLPQLGPGLYLTDGGIETTLIFHEGLELPDFAAFHLLKTPAGEAALRKYFRTYAELAKRFATGLVLESATWRANPDWGTRLGYTPEMLADANRRAIHLLEEIRNEHETQRTPVVISGCLGPRGDGYVPDRAMSEQEAEAYHQLQVETFAGSAADMVCAITMNYVEEAVGIARAAQRADMPVAISFTVETDGNLPTGQPLRAALEQVDRATSAYPCYYMINCAHPTHFEHVLGDDDLWMYRIGGLRANASCKSHAELNESPELDMGNPVELGTQYAALKKRLPRLNVMGGCCGTDHRHVAQIAEACSPLFRAAVGGD